MVKTRQTSEDSMSAKINKLKVCVAQSIKSSNVQRRSDICRRFDPPAEEPKLSIKTPKGKPKKRVEYELPDYTQWFDIDSINYIEEECADNIFIGYGHDKDALHEVYKKVRNKIVELYRIEPTKFLTVTDCIRRLGMDASIVMKVHSLLNYWGIINYQATNTFGEKIFNKRLNEQVVDLKGNQSNIHKKRVKLNFNQILDKDSTEANINTYYNDLSYNDYTKYNNCTKKRFDFNSIEDVVRYSSELNSGHYGMNLNYPLCSGCSNPCKASYYILGPDSLGEVNSTVRTRGLWCSMCYCNSNYPITLNKDSFVRIDLPPRLSETISRLFEKNRNLFSEPNASDNINGIIDSKEMRSRDVFNNEMLEGNFSKNTINTGISGTQIQKETINNDDNLGEFESGYNEDDVVGNFMNTSNDGFIDDNYTFNRAGSHTAHSRMGNVNIPMDANFNYNMTNDGLDGADVLSSDIEGASDAQMTEMMKNRFNEINTFLDNRDGISTVYGSPILTSNPKNPEVISANNHSYEGTQRFNDDYDSYAGDSYNGSPKIQYVRHDNDDLMNTNHGRYGESNDIPDMSRFSRSNVKMPWTTEDFERLYEAIRKYGTDWQSVAQHMGEDSTPNECVFQFINAPLEKEVTSKLKLTTYMEPPTTSLLGQQFPFFDSPNTIVTLLSFCASVVSPVVASYAAKAAFNIILKASAKTAIHENKEITQIQPLGSNENSTNERVYSHPGNTVDDSLNYVDTAINSVDELHNGTLPNNHGGNTLVNSIHSTSSNTGNYNDEREGSLSNHVKEPSNTTGAMNGISTVDTGEIVERNSDLEDGTSTEGEGQNKGRVSKFVDGTTLQLAAAAALGAAAARAGELAEKEEERLSEALPHLISLKIRRITEKLNRYNETQEKMKSDQMHLEKELFRILKCKGIFQNNS